MDERTELERLEDRVREDFLEICYKAVVKLSKGWHNYESLKDIDFRLEDVQQTAKMLLHITWARDNEPEMEHPFDWLNNRVAQGKGPTAENVIMAALSFWIKEEADEIDEAVTGYRVLTSSKLLVADEIADMAGLVAVFSYLLHRNVEETLRLHLKRVGHHTSDKIVVPKKE